MAQKVHQMVAKETWYIWLWYYLDFFY